MCLSLKQTKKGFTIVELIIVIVVLGILATITVVGIGNVQLDARDKRRASSATVLSEAFEKYYDANGEYPSCPMITGTSVSVSDAFHVEIGVLKAPQGATSNSIVCADMTDDTSKDAYAYVGDGGSSCMSGASCLKYTIKYKEEASGTIKSIDSRRGILSCPAGYIVVPGSSVFSTIDFCVMKYEAKNIDGVAKSQAAGTPWAPNSQTIALTKSVTACEGCHLITENEWLTIAHNIMSVPSNWSGGAIGAGSLYSGHNDNNPGNSLAASSDGSGYAGTGNTSGTQRRTLTLTNGQVIWDLAGNVWELTQGAIAGSQQPGLVGETYISWKEYNNPNLIQRGLANNAMPGFGTPAASGWSSAQGIGQLYSNYGETNARVFIRGGAWYDSSGGAGILALDINHSPLSVGSVESMGFRVAQR